MSASEWQDSLATLHAFGNPFLALQGSGRPPREEEEEGEWEWDEWWAEEQEEEAWPTDHDEEGTEQDAEDAPQGGHQEEAWEAEGCAEEEEMAEHQRRESEQVEEEEVEEEEVEDEQNPQEEEGEEPEPVQHDGYEVVEEQEGYEFLNEEGLYVKDERVEGSATEDEQGGHEEEDAVVETWSRDAIDRWYNHPLNLRAESHAAKLLSVPWSQRGPRFGPQEGGPRTWRGSVWRPNTQKWATRGGRNLKYWSSVYSKAKKGKGNDKGKGKGKGSGSASSSSSSLWRENPLGKGNSKDDPMGYNYMGGQRHRSSRTTPSASTT